MAWLLRKRKPDDIPDTAKAEPLAARGTIDFDPSHLKEDLQRCCSLQVPMVVIAPDKGVVCQARFIFYSEHSVTMELTADPTGEFLPLSACCVTLCRQGRAYLFGSVVREYTPRGAGRPARLVLRVPDQVMGAEMRETYRVPVAQAAGLVCTLLLDGLPPLRARVVDISLGGLLAEFPRHEDPGLSIGQKPRVELTLEERTVSLDAEIRRADENRYGIFFPDHFRSNEVRVPDAFRAMVLALERIWLRERSSGATELERP